MHILFGWIRSVMCRHIYCKHGINPYSIMIIIWNREQSRALDCLRNVNEELLAIVIDLGLSLVLHGDTIHGLLCNIKEGYWHNSN